MEPRVTEYLQRHIVVILVMFQLMTAIPEVPSIPRLMQTPAPLEVLEASEVAPEVYIFRFWKKRKWMDDAW